MDRKVPDEEEKKNPTKKKSSSGCHNPHEAKWDELGFKVRENLQLTNTDKTTKPICLPALKAWQYSSILAEDKIFQAVILPHVGK